MSAPEAVRAPVDVPRLLPLLAVEPQPRLTWVSVAGDRVELSGRVLVNWVAKTAHLLVAECDLSPEDVLRTALGTTWRAPVLWLAAWHLGAAVAAQAVSDVAPEAEADVWVVPDGSPAPGTGREVVVVAAGTLATRSTDERVGSEGWVDYAAEVRLHPDALPPGQPWGGAGRVRASGGPRLLLPPSASPEQLLAVWADGGSVVWHDGLDPAALARLADQEHATP